MCLEQTVLHALVLSGHATVLEQASLLESLAQRCHQPAAMNWLSYFLNVPNFRGKKPYLVLIVRPGVTGSSLSLEGVHAAVLLFEYRVMGMSTGAFSTDDWSGFRSVIAPEAERGAIAAMAADAMLEHAAQLVLISYGHAGRSTSRLAPVSRRAMRWGWRTRSVAMTLPLEPTFEGTLAKLGKRTRVNLRYYRRRLEAAVPCEFVPDARGLLQEHELEALNVGALDPIALDDIRHRYESSCQLPGGFLLGLRDGEGKWLSLIGGWRQDDVTVLYWQMNTAGYEKLSIGTAMRSYFLEHEVEHGARTLIVLGGTTHSMSNSFIREEATDLIVQRRSLRASFLQIAARLVTSPQFGMRIHSVLAQAIGGKDVDWYSMSGRSREQEPQRSEL
jgi:hypothetical protein